MPESFNPDTIYHIGPDDFQIKENLSRGKIAEPGENDDRIPHAMHLKDAERLKASIDSTGFLTPVLFHVDENGNKIIADGERRLEAAKQLGLETIPAKLISGDPLEVGITVNILRKNYTAVQEAKKMAEMKRRFDLTDRQLGAKFGKSRSTITEILGINRLPDEILDECRFDKRVSKDVLIKTSKGQDGREMKRLWKKYKGLMAPNGLRSEITRKRLELDEAAIRVSKTFATRLTNIEAKLNQSNAERPRLTAEQKTSMIDELNLAKESIDKLLGVLQPQTENGSNATETQASPEDDAPDQSEVITD